MDDFVKRYGYEPEKEPKPIIESAPDWLRLLYIENILRKYVDFGEVLSIDPIEVEPVYSQEEIIDKLAIQLKLEKVNKREPWKTTRILLRECEWYQFYNFVEIIGRSIQTREIQINRDVQEATEMGIMDPELAGGTDVLTVSLYQSYADYQRRVNELFKEVQVMWELDHEGNLTRVLPDDVYKLSKNVQQALREEHPVAYDHLIKSDKAISSIPLDPEITINQIVSAVESLARELVPEAHTLGQAVKVFRKESNIPEYLINIVQNLWDYSNNIIGGRHGQPSDSQAINASREQAEFCFYLGMAILNYLKTEEYKPNNN